MVTVIFAAGFLAALTPSVPDTRPTLEMAPVESLDEVDAGDISFVLDAEREKIRVRVLVASIRLNENDELKTM